MKNKKFIVITLGLLLLIGVFTTIGLSATAETKDGVISKGIYIGTVDVGNMTAEQAQKAVEKHVQVLKNRKLEVDVSGNKVTKTLDELGFEVVENDYIEEALKVGKIGNIIKRYKDLKDIEKEKLVYTLEFTVDNEKLKALVEEECTKYDVKAKNASLKRKDGKFVTTKEETGRHVNVDETVAKINQAVISEAEDKTISLTAIVVEDLPSVTEDMVKKCTTLLGSYSTNFSSSGSNRSQNLNNAAKLINGTVLNPGETFSCVEVLGPFTKENGYEEAGAFQNGKVIESVGGGVCQVSTTLYNAVLRAELEIVERKPHSMVVSYVNPAEDAAIAGTYKDLKFKNNSQTPVYIEGYISGKNITFNIYGEETRASNRTIEFKSEVVETIQPGAEVVTKDATQPVGYRKVTQTAHIGYKAYLYKIVYEDGKQVDKIQVNYSQYSASPQYVTVGTKEKTTSSATPNKSSSDSSAATNRPIAEEDVDETSQEEVLEPNEDTATETTAPTEED